METSDSYQLISQNMTLAELLDSFLLAKEVQPVSRKTLLFYHDEIGHFIRFAVEQGAPTILSINAQILRLFLQHMGETRNKGGVHASWRAVRAMINWYEMEVEPEGWSNPVRKVKLPAPRIKPIPGISMEDYRKLIAVCTDHSSTGQRDRAMLYTLLDTCARATEFLDFNVSDCNILTGVTLIRSGKGDQPRFVMIGKKARKELRLYLKTRHGLNNNAPLFINREGARVTYDGLYSLIRWRCSQAGIEVPGLHDIRRAGALELLRNKADLAYVSRYLGHEDIRVTMRYLAITPDDLRVMHSRASPVDNL